MKIRLENCTFEKYILGMESSFLRLCSLAIDNFKNVIRGDIDFSFGKTDTEFGQKSSVTALYGQNGSGKTSVIYALDLLKRTINGLPLWSDMDKCITAGQNVSTFTFAFILYKDYNPQKKITYSFSVKQKNGDTFAACYENEKISVSEIDDSGKWSYMNCIFEYNRDGNSVPGFLPKNKFEQTVKGNPNFMVDITVADKLAKMTNASFLFSKDFLNCLERGENRELSEIIRHLKKYASSNLFVINNTHSGIISCNDILPIAVKHKKNQDLVVGDIIISQQAPTQTDENSFALIQKVIANIGIVMGALVPGLNFAAKEISKNILPNGSNGILFELVAVHDDKKIPIRYESEGIKKLFSVIYMITEMYNNPATCVAIDELDAGVFEHLLGELLNIIDETGAGQLIITSHNLRPLEVISKECVVCTTTNASNRYIRLKNIKPSNNLRDCYIRALNLGGQDENLSIQADGAKIRRALRKAEKNAD